ncbi:MAG: hypothetical protein QF464_23195, partial [Myxococcota bacterium]|nr:hypothetical protein [Myxococcota bacterium]
MNSSQSGWQWALLTGLTLLMMGCADDVAQPGPGDPCDDSPECTTGLCHETCLDPASDDDSDGLTNEVEVALGTDPQSADTDGDGLSDGVEIGDDLEAPADEDGDGKIDALESDISDADGDCLSEQRDPDDTTTEEDMATLLDAGCCCAGSCADLGIAV